MNKSNIMSAIVTFDVSEVSKNTDLVLRYFYEMDDLHQQHWTLR
ncbi:hypothetical protein [Vibrio nigripulchritudo]|nr:hypothetical protein [Vibrio nigripulchritudo]